MGKSRSPIQGSGGARHQLPIYLTPIPICFPPVSGKGSQATGDEGSRYSQILLFWHGVGYESRNYLLNSYYSPDAVLVHVLSYFILSTMSKDRLDLSHVTGEHWGSEELRNVPKITELLHSRAESNSVLPGSQTCAFSASRTAQNQECSWVFISSTTRFPFHLFLFSLPRS